jgi:hypothetical protein
MEDLEWENLPEQLHAGEEQDAQHEAPEEDDRLVLGGAHSEGR